MLRDYACRGNSLPMQTRAKLRDTVGIKIAGLSRKGDPRLGARAREIAYARSCAIWGALVLQKIGEEKKRERRVDKAEYAVPVQGGDHRHLCRSYLLAPVG